MGAPKYHRSEDIPITYRPYMHPVKAHLARLMVSCRKRIIRDGNRAGEVVARIRAFFKKAETAKGPLDLNATIREVIDLAP